MPTARPCSAEGDLHVLDVSTLVCAYRTDGNGAKTVLDGVSFSVDEGGCLGLIGDSGGGKSTIARCVAGLMRPDAGRISICGTNVFPDVKNRRMLAGKVQMLYQDHAASFDPIMTVRESLEEGVRVRANGGAIPAGRIVRMLEEVGLGPDMCDKFPRQLSGGERQRVALARSLSVDPPLLVLDEPTSSLDEVTQVKILDLVASMQQAKGTAILFISHDITSIARICDRIAVLCGGRIVESGPTASVLANPSHPYTKRIAELHA